MYHFWEIIIKPVLTMLRPEVIVEIGSDQGKNTVCLLEFCRDNDAILHAVDPVPKFDVDALKKQYGRHFVFHQSLSLNAIPRIKVADIFLIDGDHNWYTVFNELKLIEKQCSKHSQAFPLIMLHDIGWPYGRRDLYYNPETIPDEFRKPYKQKGIHPDSAELLEEGGLNQHLNNSIYENDLRSGVLTAIEDFLAETDQSIEFVKLHGLNGLGILVPPELKEQNKRLRAFLKTLDVGRFVADYIQEIENIEIQTKLSLSDTKLLVSEKNQEIKRIKEERNEKIQELREQQSLEIQKLREQQSLEIQKLREGQKLEIDKLRTEQRLAIERLQGEIEKRDRWIHEVTYDILELLHSKRWKTGVMLGELYRKMLLKPHVPTAADYIQKLIKKTPAKQNASNRLSLPSSKKKVRELKPRKALHFVVIPEEQIPEGPVTIIIPIFNAFEDVERCLESVLRHTPSPHEILLINDGSSDQRIEPLLQRYVDNNPRVNLITNTHNLGYTRTINIGCKSCSTDVVLLNSDTVVTPFWVDRLRESAYRKREIGTVTPVSNNAGAFSVPEIGSENEIPDGYTLDSYAELISKLGIRYLPEVFTGSGFCLYIKRSVLDAIGLFDEVHFPMGYGEENDFCLRAVKAGFSNVIDDGVYIYHRRAASFGSKKTLLNERARVQLRLLYPECDSLIKEFQDDHPLLYFTGAVKNAFPIDAAHNNDKDSMGLVQQSSAIYSKKQDTLLFVIHDGGGGSVFTAWDLARSIRDDFRCLLLVCGTSQWHLYDLRANREIYVFDFDIAWDPIEPIDPLRLSMLKFICKEFSVSIVHIRSLIGLSPELLPFLKYIDVKIVFSFHDLYTLCPTIHLIDNNGVFCGGDCSPGKGICYIRNKWYRPIPDLKHGYIHEWRNRMKNNLMHCDAFITTAHTTKEIIEKYYPRLKKKDFFIIEHGRDIIKTEAKAVPPEGKLIRVAAIGAGAIYKGALLLRSIVEQNAKHMRKRPHDIHFEFHLFGGSDGTLPPQLPGFINHGPYERDFLSTYLDEIKPSFSIIPSIVPESYCHTLTESWCYGMPVCGSDIGAIRERILEHGGGWLLDSRDPKQWFEQMLEIAGDLEGYQKKIKEIEKMHFKTTEEMKEEYENCYISLLEINQREKTVNSVREEMANDSP